jgi:hypothetical protein
MSPANTPAKARMLSGKSRARLYFIDLRPRA